MLKQKKKHPGGEIREARVLKTPYFLCGGKVSLSKSNLGEPRERCFFLTERGEQRNNGEKKRSYRIKYRSGNAFLPQAVAKKLNRPGRRSAMSSGSWRVNRHSGNTSLRRI